MKSQELSIKKSKYTISRDSVVKNAKSITNSIILFASIQVVNLQESEIGSVIMGCHASCEWSEM